MDRIVTRDIAEAEELLHEVGSWSEEEVEELPKFYRAQATRYRRLSQQGKD